MDSSSPAPCDQPHASGVFGARGGICGVAGGNGETSALGAKLERDEASQQQPKSCNNQNQQKCGSIWSKYA